MSGKNSSCKKDTFMTVANKNDTLKYEKREKKSLNSVSDMKKRRQKDAKESIERVWCCRLLFY